MPDGVKYRHEKSTVVDSCLFSGCAARRGGRGVDVSRGSALQLARTARSGAGLPGRLQGHRSLLLRPGEDRQEKPVRKPRHEGTRLQRRLEHHGEERRPAAREPERGTARLRTRGHAHRGEPRAFAGGLRVHELRAHHPRRQGNRLVLVCGAAGHGNSPHAASDRQHGRLYVLRAAPPCEA